MHPRLLEPFRAGRRDVLEQVYRFHVRHVDGYLRALTAASGAIRLRQASTVADLLQEVFMRAFSPSARAAFDGVRDYQPYLTTIARNCFIDLLRARCPEISTEPDDLDIEASREDLASAEPSDPRIQAVLLEYLAGLGPELRGVYEQRFVLGRSQLEAASELGLSRRGLRTAEGRLRGGLRKALMLAGLLLDEPPRLRVKIVRSAGHQST
jgi:RNA polymerase sigma factor (sigma-70 family)